MNAVNTQREKVKKNSKRTKNMGQNKRETTENKDRWQHFLDALLGETGTMIKTPWTGDWPSAHRKNSTIQKNAYITMPCVALTPSSQ
jgi:hypothetical protein